MKIRVSSVSCILSLVGALACRPDDPRSESGGTGADEVGDGDSDGDSGTDGGTGGDGDGDGACAGIAGAERLGVSPPTPPRVGQWDDGELPDDAAFVATIDELVTALADDQVTAVILQDGVYGPETLPDGVDWLNLRGQALWAENPGHVTLGFGVQVGGPNDTYAGSEIHGIVFDIDNLTNAPHHPLWDPNIANSPAAQDAAIFGWGSGQAVGSSELWVSDCTIRGNGVLTNGIRTSIPEGLRIERVALRDLTDHGIFAGHHSQPILDVEDAAVIRDVDIDGISPTVLTNDWVGVAIVIGNRATLERIRIRDVRWAGITTNGLTVESVLRDLDIDIIGPRAGDPLEGRGGVAVYLDRWTQYSTIEDFCIGPRTRIGVNSEWDNLGNAMSQCKQPRGLYNEIRHGIIESSYAGVNFEQGTVNCQVREVIFRNYERSGVVMHHNWAGSKLLGEYQQDYAGYLMPPSPEYDDGSCETDNEFDGGGLCDVTREYVGSPNLGSDCEVANDQGCPALPGYVVDPDFDQLDCG